MTTVRVHGPGRTPPVVARAPAAGRIAAAAVQASWRSALSPSRGTAAGSLTATVSPAPARATLTCVLGSSVVIRGRSRAVGPSKSACTAAATGSPPPVTVRPAAYSRDGSEASRKKTVTWAGTGSGGSPVAGTPTSMTPVADTPHPASSAPAPSAPAAARHPQDRRAAGPVPVPVPSQDDPLIRAPPRPARSAAPAGRP
ncbi:hypothetical protein VSR01_36625 [Actinacidiphila sp. DG2A-62]|uniref:hypothetical protein n=1 Tax=Actinacidiphila sp. DG2A-62 TaxID=3108821 RepID=UPI002DBE067A|nr:hypothetical protein [Actinacidiphila sp. DG2A-62]MEC3998719.1 hypothetical protein [Actinacidiphila sp. DG2A-62]